MTKELCIECDKECKESRMCNFFVLGFGLCESCKGCRRKKFIYLKCSDVYMYRHDKIHTNPYCEVYNCSHLGGMGFCRCCKRYKAVNH